VDDDADHQALDQSAILRLAQAQGLAGTALHGDVVDLGDDLGPAVPAGRVKQMLAPQPDPTAAGMIVPVLPGRHFTVRSAGVVVGEIGAVLVMDPAHPFLARRCRVGVSRQAEQGMGRGCHPGQNRLV